MSSYYSPILGKIIDSDRTKADLVNGKIPLTQLPSIAISENLGIVANEAAMLLVSAQIGDVINRSDDGKVYQLINYPSTDINNWISFSSAAATALLKTGGTMTGNLILNGDATLPLQATTLQQVQNINISASQINNSTTAGRAILTSIDVAAQRTNLGLGSLATQSGNFSGTSSGTNTGDQDLSGLVVKSNNLSDLTNAATARTNLGLGNINNTSDINKPASNQTIGLILTIGF